MTVAIQRPFDFLSLTIFETVVEPTLTAILPWGLVADVPVTWMVRRALLPALRFLALMILALTYAFATLIVRVLLDPANAVEPL